MSALVLRGDARNLPLPDASVDLILCSPPYFGLRSYTDGGEHYAGQVGSESTPAAYVAALVECTREWMRALKPSGSIFVNLGDKYAQPGKGERNMQGVGGSITHKVGIAQPNRSARDVSYDGLPGKCLMGLPWRYALACTDQLGLILRAEIIWAKPNGLPESVTDRVRRSHEQIFHFTRQPRYYTAVDEIREAHAEVSIKRAMPHRSPPGRRDADVYNGQPAQTLALAQINNPLGKLPGSVWDIPSQPLTVPLGLGVDHFAAFPTELPRRIIRGWSPPGVCTACGEGRRPVAPVVAVRGPVARAHRHLPGYSDPAGIGHREPQRVVTGYACACTPFTDHPERRGKDFHRQDVRGERGANDGNGGERFRRYMEELANPRGPVREYHFDAWQPAPTRPAVVVDPFGGTGTTALVADVLGRTGISIDRSADYGRIAQWRTTDPGERARALGVPKPPKEINGQSTLFEGAG